MRMLLLYVLLLACCLPAFSQKYLALEHNKRFKRIIFKPGDYVRFQTHDGEAKYSGIIEAVDDSTIVLVKVVQLENEDDATNNVFRDYVPIKEIRAIYNGRPSYWKYFKRMYSGTAMVGGGLLIVITALNTLLENDVPDPNSLIITSAILTSGLIVRYIGRDKYKIGKKWSLRAMEPMVLDSELETMRR